MIYVRDKHGRVGTCLGSWCLDDPLVAVTFPFGKKTVRNDQISILNKHDGEAEFERQRVEMWKRVTQFRSHEADVLLLCEAALTHFVTNSSVPLKAYLKKTLQNAAKQQVTEPTTQLTEHATNNYLDKNDQISLIICRELLHRAAITEEEFQLLLLRFDSKLPLRSIATIIGVSSPSTVAAKIDSLCKRIRQTSRL